jgi:hypothetical protein
MIGFNRQTMPPVLFPEHPEVMIFGKKLYAAVKIEAGWTGT